jgi:exonuclease VII large subunit
MQGQTPSQMRLRQLGAEEGTIRNALSRMEGFFGDALPPELRQRMQQSSQHLRWLEQNLPEGRLGKDAQQRQQHVLETLLQLAQVLSGQQGNQQGQQQARQGQTPSRPDINWGRFVEHGPPMRQVPEALQGAKGGASFAEPAKSISVPPPTPSTMLRPSVLPAYRDSVRKYQQQIR